MKRYRLLLGALLGVHLLVVWLLPVLPCQDLPQHLAYTRILVDHARADLPFARFFELPGRFELYFVPYYLLALAARVVPLGVAMKLLFSAYATGVMLAFHRLCRTVASDSNSDSDSSVPWPGLLGATLVWSPIACMGFLQLMLATPLFVLACAGLLARTRSIVLWLAAAGLALLHPVAGLAFLVVVLIDAAVVDGADGARRVRMRAAALAAMVLALLLLAAPHGALGGLGGVNVDGAMRHALGLEVVDELLGLTWYTPPVTLTYVLSTVLGPWRAVAQLALALLFVTAIVLVRRWSPPALASPGGPRARLRRVGYGLALIAVLAPWGIARPTELTFLNLRLLVLAFPLVLAALVGGRRFVVSPRARAVLVVVAALVTLHAALAAAGFAREAGPVLALIDRTPPGQVLLSLSFHGRSDHYGRQQRVTHFLPLYYTVRRGGIDTQFWGRYTEHLPIAYRPSMEPRHPSDFSPGTLALTDLATADYLLIEYPDWEDPLEAVADARRIGGQIAPLTTPIECRDLWCLYRVKPEGTKAPPTGGR